MITMRKTSDFILLNDRQIAYMMMGSLAIILTAIWLIDLTLKYHSKVVYYGSP